MNKMASNPFKFCKIIDQEQTESLRLPKKFALKCGENLPKKEVYLKVPNGLLWPVEVKYSKPKNKICLKKGWSGFRRHYSIGPGYYLEFKYNGVARFDVIIFDRTGSEIQYKPNHISRRTNVEDSGQTSDDPMRFCEIIVDPECDRVRVPKTFTKRYGVELPHSASVRVPGSTTMWEVELVRAEDGEIYVMGGRWNEFIDYYDVSSGHSLVIEFLKKCGLFDVWIYDGTGTEKDMVSAFQFNLDDLHVEGYDSDKDDTFVFREEILKKQKGKEKLVLEDYHQEEIRTSVGIDEHGLNKRRELDESDDSGDDSVDCPVSKPARREKLGVGTKADKKTGKNARKMKNSLSFTKEIKLINKHRLDLPRDFARAIGNKPQSLRLKNDQGRKWTVKMIQTGPDQYSVTAGWNSFLIGNNVVVGSIISFVLTSGNTIKTHVEKAGSDRRALFKFVRKRGAKFELCNPGMLKGKKLDCYHSDDDDDDSL